MYKILFVCHGNICRSTMAEALLRHKLKGSGLDSGVLADSAGTHGYHAGEPPHRGTRDVLQRHGISWEGIRSRQITAADFDSFDLVIGMDGENMRDLRRLSSGCHDEKLCLMSGYSHRDWPCGSDLPDPWYTGDFDLTFQLLDEACDGMIEVLKKQIFAEC